MTEDLPDPWYRITDQEVRAALEVELANEIGGAHVLANRSLSVIAKRDDRDDVLVALDQKRVVQVHLTWSGRIEADPRWPTSTIYDSMADWRVTCIEND